MAMEANPLPSPSAQVVGNAFVEQYYHVLHHSPEVVYRFYQDSSILSRQDVNGDMASVTTMQNINEKICSLDYKNYKAEIKTADAQESYRGGVVVLVTGCLTGKDGLQRKFVQTFFLAPQDNGYFVLNDIFRYVEENEPDNNVGAFDRAEVTDSDALTPVPDPVEVHHSPEVNQATSHVEEVQNMEEIARDKLNEESQVNNDKEIPGAAESHINETHVSATAEAAVSNAFEDTPKKSYASILSSQTKKGPSKVYVPARTSKVAVTKVENQLPVNSAAQALAPESSPPASPDNAPASESRDVQDEVEGHSIYIRNLPLNITVPQLEDEFKKFGPIKQGGVQVRNNRQQGFCFGFVEFQDLSSMHSAIQASPISIGGHQAVAEMKRTTTRVGSGRGRFPPGQGGFRSDNFRIRANFGSGRGYGRNDFGSRDFSGRGRGQGGRGGQGYQQGRGRGGRRGFPSPGGASEY